MFVRTIKIIVAGLLILIFWRELDAMAGSCEPGEGVAGACR